MIQALVIIHLLVAIALILLILMQKSEGAAGAGMSATASVTSMVQPRGRPNPLSRMTTILGIGFFATSLGLALLSKPSGAPSSSMFAPQVEGPAVPSIENSVTPSVPATDAPAATPQAAPGESPAPSVPNVPNK